MQHWPVLNQADHSLTDKNTEGFALSDNEKMWLSQNCECVAQFLASWQQSNQETIMSDCYVWICCPGKGDFISGGVSLHLVPSGWPRDCIA